ncbi:MAG: MlaC/ttg2D family ABC transporter substrate-binding protein [Gammaproteobacteria bacterium]
MNHINRSKNRRADFCRRAAGVAVAAAICCAAFAAPSPEDVGEDLAARNDAIVGELRRLRADGELSPEDALRLIRRELSPIIDFRRISGQSAGKYWRRASDDEKNEITAAFQDLLEGVYAKVLARYSDQEVRLVESKLRGDGTILAGVEVRDGERTARIEYVFYEKDGAAKITDVLVEGVSLLDTYRRQFARIAKKDGVAGLAARLREIAAK